MDDVNVPKTPKSIRQAVARYDAANTRKVAFKFNLKTDADILDKFSSLDNVQGYIKRLIREDIAKNG